jgi:hypothetical protein
MARKYALDDASGFNAQAIGLKVAGGALATQKSRDAALASQMKGIPYGRRVLAQAGLHGQAAFFVVDGTDPDAQASQVYPTSSSSRVMLRTRSSVTPGHRIAARGLFARSGPVQVLHVEPANLWDEFSPGQAKLTVQVTLDNGTSTLIETWTAKPKWSVHTHKGLKTGAGGAFDEIEELSYDFNFGAFLNAPGWVEHVMASIVITAHGGVRPVDVVVYEVSRKAVHDETLRECTVPGFIAPSGIEWPITGIDFPDQALRGSIQANKTLHDQRRVLGPRLVDWTPWLENAAVTTEEGAVTFSSTSYEDMRGLTAWDSANPGWSLSAGAWARNLEQNGPLELRNKNACVQVLIRFSAKVAVGGNVGTICFQTEDYSLRAFTVTATSYTWHEGLAWLRCGVHPTHASVLQVFGKVGGAGQSVSIRAFSIEAFANPVTE